MTKTSHLSNYMADVAAKTAIMVAITGKMTSKNEPLNSGSSFCDYVTIGPVAGSSINVV